MVAEVGSRSGNETGTRRWRCARVPPLLTAVVLRMTFALLPALLQPTGRRGNHGVAARLSFHASAAFRAAAADIDGEKTRSARRADLYLARRLLIAQQVPAIRSSKPVDTSVSLYGNATCLSQAIRDSNTLGVPVCSVHCYIIARRTSGEPVVHGGDAHGQPSWRRLRYGASVSLQPVMSSPSPGWVASARRRRQWRNELHRASARVGEVRLETPRIQLRRSNSPAH